MSSLIQSEICELKSEIQMLLESVPFIKRSDIEKITFFNELFDFKLEMLKQLEEEYQQSLYDKPRSRE